MISGKVYRVVTRDAHGDPIDADGKPVRLTDDGLVGTVVGLIMGGQAVQPVTGRGEVASTEGLIGAPRGAAVKLQHGDRLVIGQITYQISGPRLWDFPSNLTGQDLGLYWIKATATTN
ncbi:Uncharacterised protein [Mycobacteroides abscessus subsp. abscessus]|uniref:hypothetical protein n=1 Tax=Mycobacteroides abscessus TaxID=36809 RepID=UPI0009270637|nr:hypothetical protein [Mycobacteroides abscessus]SHX04608.1 Uncharacterised protein [Mycobacteroides abscessus subsp. abscessus]SID11958.1 Uncharacterised protein [Mycobacteroides abscessus subsp. abscessus]SIE18693.1 Uncharacterised protein [Mycobacteroides abscessus subsp. abscessus]SIH46908.1 Uncharacterised protein [Mycobacteroides abscessus subsp. abscessus]SKK58038.1 Uncharacterised protein [Mycobacteroides abscessus subsp. abscessus]